MIIDGRFAAEPTFDGRRLVSVVADEQHKTLAGVERLLVGLREVGAARSDRLVAVGGGLVQDVATLAPQLYMRGLAWSYASTTLPDTALAGGLAEATKISYCRGPSVFERYLQLEAEFGDEPRPLIHHSLNTKRWFIETDEFDTGPRRLLNFGYTFGHALEAATGYAVEHGMGVAIGMIAAERFGVVTGYGVADARLSEHAALRCSLGAIRGCSAPRHSSTMRPLSGPLQPTRSMVATLSAARAAVGEALGIVPG